MRFSTTLIGLPATAQFTGPSPAARNATVAQANAAVNSCGAVTGNLDSHLRGDIVN
jgi:hypothetical protein